MTNYSQLKRSFQTYVNDTAGFSIVELLVANTISLLMLAMMYSAVMSNRNVYQTDMSRTRLNQNLRGSLDVLTVNGREAGENLIATFPAVELVNGASGAPDTLTFRRNLRDEVLQLCQAISASSSNSDIYFTDNGTTPPAGCIYTDNQINYTAWQNFRQNNGGSVKAYIWNIATEQGEFFDYISETDTNTLYYITRASGTWTNSYPVGSPIYLLEEWQFQIVTAWTGDSMLQVIENGDTANPMNVALGITDLQVSIRMNDLSTKTTFTPSDSWTNINAIRIDLNGEDRERGVTLTRSLGTEVFPRNILSN